MFMVKEVLVGREVSVVDQASAKNGASACRIRCICAGVTSAFSTLLEARLLGAGDDVLPAVGLEHERMHRGASAGPNGRRSVERKKSASARACIWQDAVDRADQLDQLVDAAVALGAREAGVLARAIRARRASRAATPPSSGTGTRPSTASERLVVGLDARAVVRLA